MVYADCVLFCKQDTWLDAGLEAGGAVWADATLKSCQNVLLSQKKTSTIKSVFCELNYSEEICN